MRTVGCCCVLGLTFAEGGMAGAGGAFGKQASHTCPALHASSLADVLPSPAGLAWTAVEENPRMKEFFDVLSLSVDRVGQVWRGSWLTACMGW